MLGNVTQNEHSIGDVIAKLRAERRLSQNEIEEISGGKVRASWIAAIETGRINEPSLSKLSSLADVLGVSVEYIYQKAGIVYTTNLSDPDLSELTRIFSTLSVSSKRIALKLLYSLSNQGEELEDEQRERGKR